MEEPRTYETRTRSLGAKQSQAKEKAVQRGHSEPGFRSPIAWVPVLASLQPKHREGSANLQPWIIGTGAAV